MIHNLFYVGHFFCWCIIRHWWRVLTDDGVWQSMERKITINVTKQNRVKISAKHINIGTEIALSKLHITYLRSSITQFYWDIVNISAIFDKRVLGSERLLAFWRQGVRHCLLHLVQDDIDNLYHCSNLINCIWNKHKPASSNFQKFI